MILTCSTRPLLETASARKRTQRPLSWPSRRAKSRGLKTTKASASWTAERSRRRWETPPMVLSTESFMRKAMVHQTPMQQFPAQTGCRPNLKAYASGGRSKERDWMCLMITLASRRQSGRPRPRWSWKNGMPGRTSSWRKPKPITGRLRRPWFQRWTRTTLEPSGSGWLGSATSTPSPASSPKTCPACAPSSSP